MGWPIYCKGADQTFDQAAALPHQPALAFARVQWTPWRKIPDFSKLMKVYGVPTQYVFNKGKLLGDISGRPPVAPSVPLTEAEQGALRQMIRRDALKLVTGICVSRFPDHARAYQDALQAWSGARQAGLNQAATRMLARTSRADAAFMGKLVDAEQKSMQAWHTGKLGLSTQKAPAMADCDKIAAAMKDLP